MKNKLTIILDFDGTCVAHEFPEVGKDIGAAPVLKALVANGHQLILFTMRSNNHKVSLQEKDPLIKKLYGPFLDEAIKWFADNEIPLYGVQTNPTQKHWTTSPKAYGNLIIDDTALGCPLVWPDGSDPDEKPYVDWVAVKAIFKTNGIL